MNHGEWTARIGRILAAHLDKRGYEVLFDHGHTQSDLADKLGQIASWVGQSYRHEAILGHLDIAIITSQTNRAIALIEIEESTDNPKTLLGDIFATLLGERLSFQGVRQLQVGEWTTLVVLAQSSRSTHQARFDYLLSSALELKAHASAANSRIGNVTLDSFSDEADLEVKVKRCVDSAIEYAVQHGDMASL